MLQKMLRIHDSYKAQWSLQKKKKNSGQVAKQL